ncbi:MAG TPA: LppP/LprE family lipoprotein [Candidatus Corynebacterium avicola]|uniref:LppP/LprE family lipoprotein n=1 Tax=Candidatus Corynebacterium avicola TaxID=2838527 RepID=A0A9D1UM40_9CORY|nr:LppP/LprE family lipoprotein [Candidatus Corynebacterium avicola]
MRSRRVATCLVVPAAVMAVSACSGGGGTDTDDSRDNEPAFTTAAPDPCDTETIGDALDDGWEVAFCEGEWARTVLPQSDGQNLLRWDGETWSHVEPAGETFTGFRCFDREKLIDDGAPEELFGNITVCDPEDLDGGSSGSASPEPSETADSADSADSADCGEDPDSPVIREHIAEVPDPSLDDMTWAYHGESNYDPCVDLSYATVVQSEVGNAQFENQLMLFHRGKFLGVGTDTVQQHSVVSTTEDSVTVKYKDYEALEASGEANAAAPKYTTEVTYRWDGERVVPEGRIPNQNL